MAIGMISALFDHVWLGSARFGYVQTFKFQDFLQIFQKFPKLESLNIAEPSQTWSDMVKPCHHNKPQAFCHSFFSLDIHHHLPLQP